MSQSELPESWPLPPDGAPTLGKGRYRLAAKLGEGGMAAVYRAWDTELQGWLAVKVLLPEFARRRKLRKRFENEARTMMKLDHRHIVRVLDVGTQAELPFIAMELADGGCVIDWIEHYGPMPPRMAVDVTMQACKGLKAAHELGVVHRDVKPHNLLVTRRGVCRLTDFGIAQVEETGGMTKTGSVMGTMGYMAPEQRTDSKNVDFRADIYGLGATLYKLLTGGTVTDLFLAEHDVAILDGVPEALVPVLIKATAYKREQRHGSVTELARELHQAKQNLPPDPPDTPGLAMDIDTGIDPAIGTDTGLSEPTFHDMASPVPTIDEALSKALGGPDTLAPAQSQDPLLPYLMPKADEPRNDDPDYLPDYVDKASVPSVDRGFEVDVDEESKTRAEKAFQRAIELGLIDENGVRIGDGKGTPEGEGGWNPAETALEMATAAIQEVLSVIMRPLQIILAGLTVVVLFMGVMVTISATAVNGKMLEAVEARNSFFSTLEANKDVIEDLKAMGGDPGVLESYWFEFENAPTKQKRVESAYKLVSRLHNTNNYVRQHGDALPGNKVRMARERLNRIDAAQKVYEDRMVAWELEAEGARGRMAVNFGAATGPNAELLSSD